MRSIHLSLCFSIHLLTTVIAASFYQPQHIPPQTALELRSIEDELGIRDALANPYANEHLNISPDKRDVRDIYPETLGEILAREELHPKRGHQMSTAGTFKSASSSSEPLGISPNEGKNEDNTSKQPTKHQTEEQPKKNKPKKQQNWGTPNPPSQFIPKPRGNEPDLWNSPGRKFRNFLRGPYDKWKIDSARQLVLKKHASQQYQDSSRQGEQSKRRSTDQSYLNALEALSARDYDLLNTQHKRVSPDIYVRDVLDGEAYKRDVDASIYD